MPSPGHRKLSISLTILIVILAHPACGFTLHRLKTAAEVEEGPSTDLALDESVQLQVKNDLRSPNDIKQSMLGDTKATKDKFKFISDVKLIDSAEDTTVDTARETETTPETQVFVTTNIGITTQKNEEAVVNGALLFVSKAINTTSTERSVTSKNEYIESVSENDNIIQFKLNTQLTDAENITQSTADNITSIEVNSTEDANINDQVAIDSEATQNLSVNETINNDIVSVENGSTNLDKTHVYTESSSTVISTASITPSEIIEKTVTMLNDSMATIPTTPHDLDSEFTVKTLTNASTIFEVVMDASLVTTEPSWKKYTTIQRKRVESSEETTSTTEKVRDLTNAESIHTTLSIPSTETLGEELLSNANQSSTVTESPTTGKGNTETKNMPTLESIESTQSVTLGTVASKRAGFLDLSKINSALETNTASSEKQTEIYRAMEELEATDVETQDFKKNVGHESRSQLAEDAMKEELMKEEMFINHQENAKRIDEVKIDNFRQLGDDVRSTDSRESQPNAEDTLSVQPINQDRRTTLYPVGTHYKQMKRIEVQPAKPFVRDPDDNSWRNESISSLGIVFKPKNSSSKSFKEVLKTKTETELNNLQDKDGKGDTPELRARLEKITEVRKSKKKMINKFGEVVYSEYDDVSSSEGGGSDNADKGISSEIASTSSSQGPEIEVTSPMTTTEGPRYWKKRLERISKEELFKDLGLDILTTQKPKKIYNIAEYYDTTDEYDADYVTQPKIDLKKFTLPPAPVSPFKTYSPLTSPPMPHTTMSEVPRFPDRRPTVQYFPPTTKPQKVNVNDYDVDFERRVRLYTLKEPPQTAPPHEPVATDQPEIRPTVRPSDFTMFPPEDKRAHSTGGDTFDESPGFNRGTYVIKHYGDMLNEAAHDEEGRSTTSDELMRGTTQATEADYEYDTHFRKKVLDRFVTTFNENSDKFKADFPVLFNSSVVHRTQEAGAGDEGRVLASSSTFLRRLYGSEPTATRASPPAPSRGRACDPQCDVTVELSPAYELHYYVPDQEEREEAVPSPPASHAAASYTL